MPRLVISPAARVDVKDIYRYIADRDEGAARRLREALKSKFLLLAKQPYIGADRKDLAERLRMFPIGRYVIFYAVDETMVVIARVLNAARDNRSLF